MMADADNNVAEQNQDAVALIERIRGGERAAFISFYDRYSPLLFSVAARVLGDRKEAEDVLQEIMLVIWNRSGDYDPQLGTLSSWCGERWALSPRTRRAGRGVAMSSQPAA